MSLADDPWELPSARSFLDEIEAAAGDAGALVLTDVSTPGGLAAAIYRRLCDRFDTFRVADDGTEAPLEQLASQVGSHADLSAILAIDTVVIVEPSPAALDGWTTLLARIARGRAALDHGFRAIVLWPVPAQRETGLVALDWAGRLRRMDVRVWADLHAPLSRTEPLATLAEALAVELCGWRLDLAAELVGARREDLLDPLSWLLSRTEEPVDESARMNGVEMACPLSLVATNALSELKLRVWRAQLAALFPWIEEQRQWVIERHRVRLRVDDHLRSLGVARVEDIEFGALHHRLRGSIRPQEAVLIERLAKLRNALAHRSPVRADDLDLVLREAHCLAPP